MKVLFISSGNALYGISPLVKVQGISLVRHGHQIDFFTIKGKGIKGYLKAIFQLRRYIKGKKFDLIHAHYGLSGIVAFFAKTRLPLIVSFMGDDLIGSTGKGGKITKISRLLSKINRYFASKHYKYSIVKSAEMSGILNIQNSAVIPNGVDLEQFYPLDKTECRNELLLPLSQTIIVFVSNPRRPEKNFLLAQQAVDSIESKDIRLIPVFNKDHNQIRTWLNAADVVVLTSFHEGSPNIIKEAMACNCPVVSTNVGDVGQIFGNTAGCFLADISLPDFAGQLRNAIRYSKEKGKTMGRQRIKELAIDTGSIAKKITDVYSIALNAV